MDKARLEEAKKQLLWLKDFGSIKKMESVEIAITLIDAALTEPSDADVAEAIKYLEPLTKHPTLTGQYAEHLKTAITALRQYQKPTAIQWTGDNLKEIIDLVGWNESASSKWTWAEYEQVVADKGLKIFTPDGSVMAEIGDWIIWNGKDCYVTRQYQKPTDEAVQRAIEMLKEHIKMDEDAIRIRKEIGQTNDEIANSTPAKWLQNNRTILTALRQYQKPTDEAVQMAICWLETGKYNTVINGRPYSGNQAHTNVTKDVRETSITALRQYQKPTNAKIIQATEWIESYRTVEEKDWQDQDPEWRQEPGAQDYYHDMMQAFDLAIQALRQMRTEPCEVCSNGECTMVGTDYHCESECAVCRYNLKDKNFCSNCGRPLKGGEKDG